MLALCVCAHSDDGEDTSGVVGGARMSADSDRPVILQVM
jgi:hypothetical protein